MSLFGAKRDAAARLRSFVIDAVPLPPSATAADLDAVRAIDATFDPDAFLASAAALFRDVRAAFTSGSLDAVAGRLSPELTAVMGKQVRYAATITHQLTMTQIDDVVAQLVGVDAQSAGDLLTVVRFGVLGRMGPIALTAEPAPATQLAALPQRRWYEIWRLSRPAGVSSPPPAAGCPSCGAPASGSTHCHYCQALLVDATTRFRVDGIECMG